MEEEEIRMVIEVSVPKAWLGQIRGILGPSISGAGDEVLTIALIDAFIHQPDLDRIDLEWVKAVLGEAI